MLLWALCPGGGWFALALCCWVRPDCACSVCVVVCRCSVVVCFVFYPVLCGVLVLGLLLPLCCWSLLLLPGPLSWHVAVFCPGLRCCVALVCRLLCGVLLSASCLACGAVLFCSPWLVLCVVACGCQVFVAGSGCLLLFSAGVCCRGCSRLPRGLLLCFVLWFVVVPPSPVLCPVFCGAVLPCGARALAPCCPFFFACGVGLFPFTLCAVLCCAVRRAVRCRFGLRCCWCLVLCCVPVSYGVSLGVLWCGGVALVCRGVLLWRAVSCGAVSPCGAVVLGFAVCFPLLRVFPFPLKTIFRLLKMKKNEMKI